MQPEPSPPVTFSGFAEPAPYLYEFWTSEGQHVYLHDMECVSIQFAPMSRQLDLTFERIESELTDHPLSLTLSFQEARVCQWHDDATDDGLLSAAPSPERVRGQVTELIQREGAAFSLLLLDVGVEFEARSVRLQRPCRSDDNAVVRRIVRSKRPLMPRSALSCR